MLKEMMELQRCYEEQRKSRFLHIIYSSVVGGLASGLISVIVVLQIVGGM